MIEKNNKETHNMILSALEFFVDYNFNTGTWMNSEYIKRTNQVNKHNDYAKLCKQMGGKTRFAPTIE